MPTVYRTIVLLRASNVFMTFAWYAHLRTAVFYMRQPLRSDYLWAGCCLIGAAYFMFRGQSG
jgi:uncharacterized protein (DUF486 family)